MSGIKLKCGNRLKALKDYYEIKDNAPDGWFELSWKLACDYVPGFQHETRKKPGAKQKWAPINYICLYIDVEETRETKLSNGKKLTVGEACKVLSKDGKYKGIKGLRQRYYEAKAMEQIKALEESPYDYTVLEKFGFRKLAQAIRPQNNNDSSGDPWESYKDLLNKGL